MADPGPWLERLLGMSVTWVMALTDSDAFYQQGAAEVLLSAGIIPIVRFNGSNLPGHFTHMAATEQLAALYAQHGAPLFVQYLNEPGDPREWEGGTVPPDWWDIWTSRWREGAALIIERGAMAVLPDGPCFPQSPFPACSQGIEDLFAGGWVAYGGHYYGLNRPLDYPYDDAQRYGTPMTPEEYDASLDDFAADPMWRDPPLDVLNQARAEQADPDLTPLQDDTCWRGWEKVEWWMGRDLGFRIPHLMGEGGWTPKARAGSGGDFELRYTLPTPRRVAERTLAMYQEPSPLFAICPWLLASEHLGGSGWYDDAWCGGAFYDLYGFEKPVVQTLRANPPEPEPDLVRALLESALTDLVAAQAALRGIPL
jgi:hypothetical protein